VWHEAGYLPPLPSEDVWTAKLDGLRSSWTVAGEIIAGGRAVDGPTLAAAFGLVAIPWLRHAFGYTLSTAPKPPPSPLERAAAIMRESMPKAVSPFA
jgi:hypothetical protein